MPLKTCRCPRLIRPGLSRIEPPDLRHSLRRSAGCSRACLSTINRHCQQQIRTSHLSFAPRRRLAILTCLERYHSNLVSATRIRHGLGTRRSSRMLHLVGATDRFISREFPRIMCHSPSAFAPVWSGALSGDGHFLRHAGRHGMLGGLQPDLVGDARRLIVTSRSTGLLCAAGFFVAVNASMFICLPSALYRILHIRR